jgi:two-component system, response regulator PdtaR
MKILIVDDEPLVRKSLGRACLAKGHQVTEAVDGREGLQKWKDVKPDLVFLDVLMPGFSGPQVLREIGAEKGDTVVILMSAYSGEHNMETAQGMGANLFVPKPFENIFDMVAKAEELFAKQRSS